MKNKNEEIEALKFEINDLKEMVNGGLVTRNKDASFTENIRLCVMELSGLCYAIGVQATI